MNLKNFGELKAWGEILEKLNHLIRSNKLDAHPFRVIRILKHRGNERLRETVLDPLKKICVSNLHLNAAKDR